MNPAETLPLLIHVRAGLSEQSQLRAGGGDPLPSSFTSAGSKLVEELDSGQSRVVHHAAGVSVVPVSSACQLPPPPHIPAWAKRQVSYHRQVAPQSSPEAFFPFRLSKITNKYFNTPKFPPVQTVLSDFKQDCANILNWFGEQGFLGPCGGTNSL